MQDLFIDFKLDYNKDREIAIPESSSLEASKHSWESQRLDFERHNKIMSLDDQVTDTTRPKKG